MWSNQMADYSKVFFGENAFSITTENVSLPIEHTTFDQYWADAA